MSYMLLRWICSYLFSTQADAGFAYRSAAVFQMAFCCNERSAFHGNDCCVEGSCSRHMGAEKC